MAIPFDEVARILGRSPTAARQLASRGRRRVQAPGTTPDADRTVQHRVVDAFLAASRQGDFSALVTLLDPDVVVSIENVGGRIGEWGEVRGVDAVVSQAHHFARAARFCRVALLNGSPGLVMAPHGHLLRAMVFTFAGSRIANIEVMSDPARLQDLDISVLEGGAV